SSTTTPTAMNSSFTRSYGAYPPFQPAVSGSRRHHRGRVTRVFLGHRTPAVSPRGRSVRRPASCRAQTAVRPHAYAPAGCARSPAAPRRHPVLAPQMDDHEEEEQLHGPQVDAVEEVPDTGEMPPGRTLEAQDHARADDHHQCCETRDAEHVDPGRHVRWLAVRQ